MLDEILRSQRPQKEKIMRIDEVRRVVLSGSTVKCVMEVKRTRDIPFSDNFTPIVWHPIEVTLRIQRREDRYVLERAAIPALHMMRDVRTYCMWRDLMIAFAHTPVCVDGWEAVRESIAS